jgi:1-acyl-sn-glycerol-3-phosphate acyltransferase
MARTAPDPINDPDGYVDYVSKITVPVGAQVAAAAALGRAWFKPLFRGLDNLPEGPALFVGNHSFLAVDAFIFHLYMYYDHGRFLRGLGDRSLFANRHYSALAHALGGVSGQAEIVSRLMAKGMDLLLYPGGAYEAIKPPSQRYQLQWKERYGFVRLAAAAGYTIVPVASVGPDEYFDQAIESETLFHSAPVQFLMRAGILPAELRADLLPPVPVGLLGSPLPKPKTTYFAIGNPISLEQYQGQTLSTRQLGTIRRKIAKAIESELHDLLLYREQNKHRDSLIRKILSI